MRQEIRELKGFMTNLSLWTGKKIRSTLDMYLIYSTLQSENFMNFSLPSWTEDIYPDEDLFKASTLEFKIMNYNEVMRRRNGGKIFM